jgi:hypothetical protein
MVDELIENCITATREGADFPTVWGSLGLVFFRGMRSPEGACETQLGRALYCGRVRRECPDMAG